MYKACKFCCKGQGAYLQKNTGYTPELMSVITRNKNFLIFSFPTVAYFSRNFKIMANKPIKLLLTDDLNSMNTQINKTLLSGSGRGGPDPAFLPLFRENPASPTFFISFLNTAFLSQRNTLKSLISTKANKCRMQVDPFD